MRDVNELHVEFLLRKNDDNLFFFFLTNFYGILRNGKFWYPFMYFNKSSIVVLFYSSALKDN